MSTINTKIWNLEPHTKAKHEILERYLSAWIPILSKHHRCLLYIDGFSGPGKYSNGELGSPIIALRTAHKYKNNIKGNMRLLFVEKDRKRAEILENNLSIFNPIDEKVRYEIEPSTAFETSWANLVKDYKSKDQQLPPTFAFIDPFGWTGVPLSVVSEIMSYPRCEIFITFMYESINRFIGHPDQESNFDKLFGCRKWRSVIDCQDAGFRNESLHKLYFCQLRKKAAKFVLPFEMRKVNHRTGYFLFYATNHLKGIMKMKESMWKSDPTGHFTFSDAIDPRQCKLFDDGPNYALLRELVLAKFEGSITTVGEIEEFVLIETVFRESHYRRHVLCSFESAHPPVIEVINPPRNRKKGSFTDSELKIRFLPRNCEDNGILKF